MRVRLFLFVLLAVRMSVVAAQGGVPHATTGDGVSQSHEPNSMIEEPRHAPLAQARGYAPPPSPHAFDGAIDKNGGAEWGTARISQRARRGSQSASLAPKDVFTSAVTGLNHGFMKASGSPAFASVQKLGHGRVELVATSAWMSLPRSVRSKNLSTLVELWARSEGSGLLVSVSVKDTTGTVRMRDFRKSQ